MDESDMTALKLCELIRDHGGLKQTIAFTTNRKVCKKLRRGKRDFLRFLREYDFALSKRGDLHAK